MTTIFDFVKDSILYCLMLAEKLGGLIGKLLSAKQMVLSSNPGGHWTKVVYSHKLTLSLSLAMPEFDKVLPSSAHQCTLVVLN